MSAPALPTSTDGVRRGPSFTEFVCLIAMMMALNALAIDAMLPALPAIGEALGVADENRRQWVITAYLLGFGGAQLIYGPLADRFGRRPLLLVGTGVYVAFSGLAAIAPSFDTLILSRVGMGVGAAALRAVPLSVVRDLYSGRTMARVMSLSFLVFLGVPILAPSVGAAVLLIGPWRWIFGVLGLAGMAVAAWILLRLPETLAEENRRPIRLGPLAEGFREVLTHRMAMGYTLAMTAVSGALFGFITSSQQIFFDAFGLPELFPLIFAAIAGAIAVASLLNARLVERRGSRLISHAALMGFIALPLIHTVIALAGGETVWVFAVMQGLTMFCFGLISGNFGAMAMEPMGRIAGTAASVQGVISTLGGALLGFAMGQQFNGTVVPMTAGFVVMGLVALACVLWAEHGRLFSARHGETPRAA